MVRALLLPMSCPRVISSISYVCDCSTGRGGSTIRPLTYFVIARLGLSYVCDCSTGRGVRPFALRPFLFPQCHRDCSTGRGGSTIRPSTFSFPAVPSRLLYWEGGFDHSPFDLFLSRSAIAALRPRAHVRTWVKAGLRNGCGCSLARRVACGARAASRPASGRASWYGQRRLRAPNRSPVRRR